MLSSFTFSNDELVLLFTFFHIKLVLLLVTYAPQVLDITPRGQGNKPAHHFVHKDLKMQVVMRLIFAVSGGRSVTHTSSSLAFIKVKRKHLQNTMTVKWTSRVLS